MFSDFLYNGIYCGYSFEMHQQVDAIQMSTHNICLYKEVKKKYTGCNLKIMEFLDCALIGVCAVIRLNAVSTLDVPIFRVNMVCSDWELAGHKCLTTSIVPDKEWNVVIGTIYTLTKPFFFNTNNIFLVDGR